MSGEFRPYASIGASAEGAEGAGTDFTQRPQRGKGTQRFLFSLSLVAGLLGAAVHTASDLRVSNLSGERVDPFASPGGTRAIVFVFISTDCPISNKYAPELRRLHDRFAAQGVVFRFIYPNPSESTEAIRLHLAQYRHRGEVLRDPRHDLVKMSQATVTPEAVVYDGMNRFVYRGRIDNRFVSAGLQRPQPTRRDLEEVLTATLTGKAVSQATAPAVGCFIADFAP